MTKQPSRQSSRPRSKDVEQFILEKITEHPRDITTVVAAEFRISRQAANNHLKRLVSSGVLEAQGQTRSRVYQPAFRLRLTKSYSLPDECEEDRIWREDVFHHLEHLPKNVKDIWHFCFTEMFNNVIDHSEASKAMVLVAQSAVETRISVIDFGVGIFRKIKLAKGLAEERLAVLELAKGKLTTDPARHTGQGIFFTSRLLDRFLILSGDVLFRYSQGRDRSVVESLPATEMSGTMVAMSLSNTTRRIDREVFQAYSSADGLDFTKTEVPVRLAEYGDERLVSRSQAKRMLARIDQFRVVTLDFTGVDSIGQAFADEVFRVFAQAHPSVELTPVNMSDEVRRRIEAARAWQAG